MTPDYDSDRTCPGAPEILSDLINQDLLGLQQGERLWKLYCFHETGNPTGLRHRIYTKEKTDGRLALITFAVHNPQLESGDEGVECPAVRSALARVADLSQGDLDRLIRAMRNQADSDAYEEIDLSAHADLNAQLVWLRSQASS